MNADPLAKLKKLVAMIEAGEPPEIPENLKPVLDRILAEKAERANEDIEEWAQRLAEDMVRAGESFP